MNYSTLTEDISALARSALADEPLYTQEVPNFETTFEQERVLADEAYALWMAENIYN